MTISSKVPALLLALAAAAALALLATSPPAIGGGFSTVTLDPLPAPPRAGETLLVGYTVRSHGVTPMPAPGSGIAIVAPDGARTTLPGRREGPAGHYVAEVRFPSAGSWTWEAVQGDFTVQALGRVEVASAAAAAPATPQPAPAASDGGGPGAAAWALLAATVAAAALLAGVALRPGRAPAG